MMSQLHVPHLKQLGQVRCYGDSRESVNISNLLWGNNPLSDPWNRYRDLPLILYLLSSLRYPFYLTTRLFVYSAFDLLWPLLSHS